MILKGITIAPKTVNKMKTIGKEINIPLIAKEAIGSENDKAEIYKPIIKTKVFKGKVSFKKKA